MKYYKAIILLIAMLVLSSCNGLSSEKELEESYKPEIKQDETVPTKIIIPVGRRWINAADEYIEYMTSLLREQDIYIEIELFNHDMKNSDAEYVKLLNDKLLDENTVAIVNQQDIELVSSEVNLGNIVEYMKAAPNYYQNYESMIANSTYLPISSHAEYLANVVLIKNEIYSSYAKEINDISEYEDFLQWAKDNMLEKTPVKVFNQYDSGKAALSLLSAFSPRYDLVMLDAIFNYPVGLCMPKNSYDTINEIEETDEFAGIIGDIQSLLQDDMIDILPIKSFGDLKPDDYASLLMSHRDFINLSNTIISDYTAADYTIKILNPNVTLVKHSKNYIVMGKGALPRSFALFMDWLYEDISNYTEFMYGINGVDYEMVDGMIEIKNTDIDYSANVICKMFDSQHYGNML